MTNAQSSSWRTFWFVRAGLWLGLAAVFALCLKYDVALMRWALRVVPQQPGGWTEQILIGFRDFGQILPVVVACLIIAALDSRRRRIITAILLAQLLAMGVYNVGKITIVRYRPNSGFVDLSDPATRSADSWSGFDSGNFDCRSQSFPSGHAAAAFAFAGVLAAFYPRLAWLFWILAVGCAASRYVQAFHWPSDCLAGGTIGYLCARLWVRVILGPKGSVPDQPSSTLTNAS